MSVNFDKLKDFFLKDAFIISTHARVRMFQRNISTEDIENVIAYGEMIEDYPDDSVNIRGVLQQKLFHRKLYNQIFA